jgi:transposase-like protein
MPGDYPLPPVTPMRWTMRIKAEVVTAVEQGVLSAEAACARWGLTAEELGSWRAAFAVHGRKGLRATRRDALMSEKGPDKAPTPAVQSRARIAVRLQAQHPGNRAGS